MKPLNEETALNLLRQPGRRLMKMHTAGSPNGHAFYVVPGGYVEPEIAKKIIERPDAQPYDDGLFPGHPQTWRLKRLR
jgi:hypothetical protein